MTVYSRSPDWVHKAVFDGQEGILVPLIATSADLSAMLMLNETALYLWEQLSAPASLNELTGKMAAEFDLSPNAAPEIEACLGELVKLGAVRASG